MGTTNKRRIINIKFSLREFLFLFFISLFLISQDSSNYIKIIDNELWEQSSQTSQRIIAKQGEFVYSKREDKTAYFVRNFDSSLINIINIHICSFTNKPLESFSIKNNVIQPIKRLKNGGWFDNEQLYIIGYINPSLSILIIISLKEKDIITFYRGSFFAWDYGKNNIAYIKEPPHFNSPETERSRVYVNETFICYIDRGHNNKIYWASDDNEFIIISESQTSLNEVLNISYSQDKNWFLKKHFFIHNE